VCQSHSLGEIITVKGGNHSQTGKSLETIADTDDQFSVIDKLLQLIAEIEFDPVGENSSAAEMISEGKSADKSEEMIFIQSFFTGEQIVEMDQFGGTSGETARSSGLFFAIQTEAGDDQSFDVRFFHLFSK
jgi:hypothetical protein